MADRIRHIKGRNLVVCETFDDFAAAVEKTDFTVEDVVGYVTSLTNCYYWLNVESVWGAIGFTWDVNNPMDPEESAQYLNVWKRMEHVLSTGYNVDKKNPEDPDEEIPNDRPDGPMPGEEGYEYSEANKFDIVQKRRLSPITKGYGHFNRTTIPFTHIPTLPDGYRITAITGSTLANINITDGVLYIDKSNWKNLSNINNLLSRSYVLYADLDGSDITSASNILNTTGKKKLYLKANLSKIPAGTIIANTTSTSATTNAYNIIACNNDYKNLNIPIGDNWTTRILLHNTGSTSGYGDNYRAHHPLFKWEGDGPFEFEYFFLFNDYNNVYCQANSANISINSENEKYHLMNFRNYDNANNIGIYPIIQNWKADISPNRYAEVTIDCTNGVSDVRLDWDLTWRANNCDTFHLAPIKYLGNITSIGTYNPSLLVEADQWPVFNQSLVDKLNPSLGEYIFHNIKIVNATHKCPYTIDCRNLTSVRVFTHMRLTVSDYQNYDPDTGSDKAIDILPTLIIDESKIYNTFDLHYYIDGAGNGSLRKYTKIPDIHIQAISVPDYSYVTLYAGRNTYITFSRASFSGSWRSYDRSTPFLRLKKLSDSTTLLCGSASHGILYGKSYINSRGVINIIEVDSNVTDEDLKAGIVNTTIQLSRITVEHPLIVSNSSVIAYNQGTNYFKNFKLIYKSTWGPTVSFSYANYTNVELENFAKCFKDTENDGVVYNIGIDHTLVKRLKDDITVEGMSAYAYIVSMGYTINET